MDPICYACRNMEAKTLQWTGAGDYPNNAGTRKYNIDSYIPEFEAGNS
jgi:hypothetical protein